MTSGSSNNLFAHGGNLAEVRERYALGDQPLLDFSANINPLGMPESVRSAILSSIASLLHYPDTECRRLRQKLAERHRVGTENVIVGNGSTELMFLVARALAPKDACVIDPTFTEYRHAAEHTGAKCVSLSASACYSFRVTGDLLGRAAESARMVFVCNPNNPTGAVVPGAEILAAASGFPHTVFVMDEAFCNFLPNEAEVSVASEAATTRNLIVLRSLTKFYAIPGLRLGYLVAHEGNVRKMLRMKEPWTVNALAEAAGCAALDDSEFARRTLECVSLWKTQLSEALREIRGLQSFPPSVNFILARITKDHVCVEALQRQLLTRGIMIRNCSNFPGLDPTYFRVAVRSPKENARLIEALRETMEVGP